MRVLPSGKAAASQAAIRGFESHHPLKDFAPIIYWELFIYRLKYFQSHTFA